MNGIGITRVMKRISSNHRKGDALPTTPKTSGGVVRQTSNPHVFLPLPDSDIIDGLYSGKDDLTINPVDFVAEMALGGSITDDMSAIGQLLLILLYKPDTRMTIMSDIRMRPIVSNIKTVADVKGIMGYLPPSFSSKLFSVLKNIKSNTSNNNL